MDPTENLKQYIEACKQRDWHRIAELSEAMADWAKMGGAAPNVEQATSEYANGSWQDGYNGGWNDARNYGDGVRSLDDD